MTFSYAPRLQAAFQQSVGVGNAPRIVMAVFRDRGDAGAQLARALDRYAGDPGVVVLALPRGGVPVGFEIARRLGAPLDVLVVRKLGVPGQPELAMGAIASGDIEVIDSRITDAFAISEEQIEVVAARERDELERRERVFRGTRAPVDVAGRTVIVVDDGLATGSTMRAALTAIRRRGPARIICAVPVGSRESCRELGRVADDMLCLVVPQRMVAVGLAYDDFEQTTDAEVRDLLDRARLAPAGDDHGLTLG